MSVLKYFDILSGSISSKLVLNKLFHPYMSFRLFKINRRDKEITLSILLKGEKESIDIKMLKYDLKIEEDLAIFSFKDIETNKEWIKLFCKKHNNKFDIEISLANKLREFLG